MQGLIHEAFSAYAGMTTQEVGVRSVADHVKKVAKVVEEAITSTIGTTKPKKLMQDKFIVK